MNFNISSPLSTPPGTLATAIFFSIYINESIAKSTKQNQRESARSGCWKENWGKELYINNFALSPHRDVHFCTFAVAEAVNYTSLCTREVSVVNVNSLFVVAALMGLGSLGVKVESYLCSFALWLRKVVGSLKSNPSLKSEKGMLQESNALMSLEASARRLLNLLPSIHHALPFNLCITRHNQLTDDDSFTQF